MNSIKGMHEHIKSAFPNRTFEKCLIIKTSEVFYVRDSKKNKNCDVHELVEDENNFLKVVNSDSKTVVIFNIDGCFINRKEPIKRCDCIIFNASTFCFMEFKFESFTELTWVRNKNRERAIEQLSSTINFFDAAFDKNYLDYKLEAHICTPRYPKNNAAFFDLRIKFLDQFNNRCDLFESNQKTFN